MTTFPFQRTAAAGRAELRRRRLPTALGAPAFAAAALAIALAGCSSGGGLPASGTGSPAAAVSGFISALTSSTPSNACNFVVPSEQAACKTGLTSFVANIASPSIGNTSTSPDGSQALVVIESSKACLGPSTANTTCASNSNANEGLPSSSADFASAYSNAESSSTELTVPCAKVSGSWYVSFGGSTGTGTTGTGTTGTSTTTAGTTGTTGTGTTGTSTTTAGTGTGTTGTSTTVAGATGATGTGTTGGTTSST